MKNLKPWYYFLAYEAVCIVLFFYEKALINCEPCLPGTPCPPCISQEQITIFWMAVIGIPGFLFLNYFFPNFKN
ncbi:MAG: hypothetical protein DWQ02_23015 [Bacteroidetes bacterium]|nr:MAG: hypothetical protein DWQ02_23015 [Bacteroidota bacterium]